jgi:hypothetical protein
VQPLVDDGNKKLAASDVLSTTHRSDVLMYQCRASLRQHVLNVSVNGTEKVDVRHRVVALSCDDDRNARGGIWGG